MSKVTFAAFQTAIPKPRSRTDWKSVIKACNLVEGEPVPLPYADSCKQFPILRKSVIGAAAKLGFNAELAKIDGVIYVCRMPGKVEGAAPTAENKPPATEYAPSGSGKTAPAGQAVISKGSKAPSMPKPFDA